MKCGISHSYATIEEKARWFQSLSVEERMDIFCEIADLVLTVNPGLLAKKADGNAGQIQGRVQIVRLP